MMWQPNAAQPVAYAPAYNQGYAPRRATARTRCSQSVERSPTTRRRRSARRGLAA